MVINPPPFREVLDPAGRISTTPIHPRGPPLHQTLVGGKEAAGYSEKVGDKIVG